MRVQQSTGIRSWLLGGSWAAAVVRVGVGGAAAATWGNLGLWAALGLHIGVFGGCLGIGCGPDAAGPHPLVALAAGVALTVCMLLATLSVTAMLHPRAAWRVVRGPDRRTAMLEAIRDPDRRAAALALLALAAAVLVPGLVV